MNVNSKIHLGEIFQNQQVIWLWTMIGLMKKKLYASIFKQEIKQLNINVSITYNIYSSYFKKVIFQSSHIPLHHYHTLLGKEWRANDKMWHFISFLSLKKLIYFSNDIDCFNKWVPFIFHFNWTFKKLNICSNFKYENSLTFQNNTWFGKFDTRYVFPGNCWLCKNKWFFWQILIDLT